MNENMSMSMIQNEQKQTKLQRSISIARIFLILFREVGRIAEEVERFMPFIAVCKSWSGYI
jgi:hypothetical protein